MRVHPLSAKLSTSPHLTKPDLAKRMSCAVTLQNTCVETWLRKNCFHLLSWHKTVGGPMAAYNRLFEEQPGRRREEAGVTTPRVYSKPTIAFVKPTMMSLDTNVVNRC
ncbi:tyrosine-protein kinase SgK223 [Lates japonicus]|uniref:Tyrosine-protein kinase SgK223 n=1 Tax=Lates japonicus TaxID=270547 RepID=A0AAD3ML05_LATJO|nr:tyrosine-protein kinase SgK223 [Lates japonicus]